MSPVLSRGGLRATFWRASSALLASGVGLFAGGWALSGGFGAPRTLEAKQLMPVDSDRDGIPDRQELVHGTDPLAPDTDFDGWHDGEEFALNTDPHSWESFPEDPTEFSIGMTARGEGGKMMLFAATYFPHGKLENKTIRFGSMIDEVICEVPFERLLQRASIGTAPGFHGGTLMTFDIEFPSLADLALRRATYFMVVGKNGETKYASAAKAELTLKDGVPLLRRKVYGPAMPGGTMNPSNGTTIHVPIPPDGTGGIPLGWKAGQVCYQVTQITGITGSVVTHEVIDAYCDEAWETYCESDCEGTVGSSYQTIDTGVLLGG